MYLELLKLASPEAIVVLAVLAVLAIGLAQQRATALCALVALTGLAVLSGGLARLRGWTKLPAYVLDPAFWTLEGLKSTLPW